MANEELKRGRYTQEFDASQPATGVYTDRLTAGSNSNAKKMVCLK